MSSTVIADWVLSSLFLNSIGACHPANVHKHWTKQYYILGMTKNEL